MAKQIIKHACGCEIEVNLFGKHADRERKVEWLETQDCRACQIKAKNDKAKEQAEKDSLPELTGSDKQVAWAISLRAEMIEKIGEMEKQVAKPEFAAVIRETLGDVITQNTDSKTWIDNRNDPNYWINIVGTKSQKKLGL